MLSDPKGHRVTTDVPQAAESLDAAFSSFVHWRTDAMQHVEAALAADPDFALAHATRGILQFGLRNAALLPAARQALEAARAARPPQTERERLYLAALGEFLDGRITAATSLLELIVRANPRDLFALRYAQFELFWLGEVHWMSAMSERVARHWTPDDPGYPALLSIRSFGLEETGAYEPAEACGREAVQRDPTEPWGAHAVAHVLIMQGRLRDGVDWLTGLEGNWSAANHIKHHLWWHLALFHAEAGDHAAALHVYDHKLRDLDSPLMRAIPDLYIDIQNDVALLQRLEWCGVDVGERWAPIAELAAARIGNHTSPFTSAHCALALAATGRDADHAAMMEHMRDFAARDAGALGPRYTLAALPASEAALAHRKGDHERVLHALLPARHALWQMGGSHAQRDLFFQMLAQSALRLERSDVLALLLDELGAIGFAHVAERTSYAAAVAAVG